MSKVKGKQCQCEICKVHRGIGRMQRKYGISERDMASVKRLDEIAEVDSTTLGMLRFKLKELSESVFVEVELGKGCKNESK